MNATMTSVEHAAEPNIDLTRTTTVYGPVRSWRVGASLGVDLICINSVCSFNCSYCQLGSIRIRTNERRSFVPTSKVLEDFEASDWRAADIITFSGSGEPTLALNLGDVIAGIKARTDKPTLVLTNGTLLDREDVREELLASDRVFVKLDAATPETFRRVNRPVPRVRLEGIVEAASRFRQEYSGWLGIQMMFLPNTRDSLDDYARLIRRIRPNEIQVNTPTRPYPDGWYLASRGSHDGVDYPAHPLKPLSPERLRQIEEALAALLPEVQIRSVRPR
ncbi:MAG: radical SAM protein [Acidobacteriota bacterium]